MADPSPAAQAVMDALHTNNSTGPERFWARANAAAALIAAAGQVAGLDVPWSHTGSSYQLYNKGLRAAAEHLCAIADELNNTLKTH